MRRDQRLRHSVCGGARGNRDQNQGGDGSDHREAEPGDARRVETAERDSAWIGRRQLLDRPVNLLPHALDARCHQELPSAARHRSDNEHRAPNADGPSAISAVQPEGGQRNDEASDEENGKDPPDQRASESARRKHGERSWRNHGRDQHGSA